MKNILHLERKFTSKTETFIVNQVNTIDRYNVIVASIRDTKNLDCIKKVIIPENVDWISKSARYLSNKTANDLFNQLKEYDIALIHAHFVIDAWFFLKLTKKFNVPKVVSGYGHDVTRVKNDYFGYGKQMLKKAMKEYDCVLAMCEDMKKDILKIGCDEEKIKIHYHGVDVSKFVFPERVYGEKESFDILQVGTLEPKKAQDLVLEALSVLQKEHKINNFTYTCIGEGELEEMLRVKVKELGLEDKVKIRGYFKYASAEHINAYRTADVFIHPSITLANYEKEGIPGTIVEAMASGLPVVSTYHAGIPEIIKSEEDGLLLEERDVKGLANALYRLSQSPALREKLGKNAQKTASNKLDLQTGTNSLQTIYDELLK